MAEQVLAELVEIVPDGVEEDRGRTYVEYAIYGDPGEVPALPALEAAAGEGLVEIETTEIPDDWGDRWRDFHRPIEVDGRLVVMPSWSSSPAEDESKIEIVIDPGQAFGTGSHATTRMCLALLLQLADEGGATGHLADLGTGSGVLAIAATKLGWPSVEGCDHEAAAVGAARTNAVANDAEIRLRRINLWEDPPPDAQTIVANLTARLLTTVAAGLKVATRPPRRVVVSGLLETEAPDILRAFDEAGLVEHDRRVEGEWAALLLHAA
jgi:ribosomal protein L11 methyltransferase